MVWHAAGVWSAVLLQKQKHDAISNQVIYLTFRFLRNGQLHVAPNWKSSQEYSNNTGAPICYSLQPTLSLLNIYNLPDGVICNIAICADYTTF